MSVEFFVRQVRLLGDYDPDFIGFIALRQDRFLADGAACERHVF